MSIREPEAYREGALPEIVILVRRGKKVCQKPTHFVQIPADVWFSVPFVFFQAVTPAIQTYIATFQIMIFLFSN